jgi:hypothetical protein
MTEERYQLNPSYSWRRLSGGCIILDLEQGSYFTLNETASAIWQGLMDGLTPAEIQKALAEEYQLPVGKVAADVDETVVRFLKEGVVRKQRTELKQPSEVP